MHKLRKEFFQYVSFSVLGMLGLSCYILADTFFVARALGADGLAALNLAIPAFSLINGTGLLLGVGGGALFTLQVSRGAQENADAAFTAALRMALPAAVAYMLLGLFGAQPLAQRMGAEGEVLDMTAIYLRVILLGTPLFLLNNILQGFVRNDGAPGRAMTAMLAGSLGNIVLDWLFLFPLRLGIFGAVLATCLAPVIGLCVTLPHVLSKRCGFHLTRARICGTARHILACGLPSFVAEVCAGVIMVVFNALVLKEAGTVGVAAYGVVANLALVVTAVFTGVSQGAQPLLSRAFGMGDDGQFRATRRLLFAASIASSLLIYAAVLLFADPIALAFNGERSAELQRIAVQGLRLYFLSCPFAAGNIALSMALTCCGRDGLSQSLSLARGLYVLLPVVFLLSALWDLPGVFLALPAAEALVFAVFAGVLHQKTLK